MKRISAFMITGLFALCAVSASMADSTDGMKEGKPAFQSMGPLAFGPDGVLLIADTKGATLTAVATGDTKKAKAGPLKVEGINTKVAAVLGTTAEDILIDDMAVNPLSSTVYLAVSRGRGTGAIPVLVRVKSGGEPEVVSLDKVKFARASIPDAPADATDNPQRNPRRESITDIAYHDGNVLVAGISNEEFSSTLRAIPFPFKTVSNGTTVEIYHGAHGRFETRSPVRTFVPFKVANQAHLLAAYTCTPLVHFPISSLKPGEKIKGKTIAELGNRNRPLDMIVYEKDGKSYLLLANSSRGVMKIPTDAIESMETIEAPVTGGGSKGLPYTTVEGWTGIDHLDRLNGTHAVVLRRGEGGALNLESLPLP